MGFEFFKGTIILLTHWAPTTHQAMIYIISFHPNCPSRWISVYLIQMRKLSQKYQDRDKELSISRSGILFLPREHSARSLLNDEWMKGHTNSLWHPLLPWMRTKARAQVRACILALDTLDQHTSPPQPTKAPIQRMWKALNFLTLTSTPAENQINQINFPQHLHQIQSHYKDHSPPQPQDHWGVFYFTQFGTEQNFTENTTQVIFHGLLCQPPYTAFHKGRVAATIDCLRNKQKSPRMCSLPEMETHKATKREGCSRWCSPSKKQGYTSPRADCSYPQARSKQESGHVGGQGPEEEEEAHRKTKHHQVGIWPGSSPGDSLFYWSMTIQKVTNSRKSYHKTEYLKGRTSFCHTQQGVQHIPDMQD